MQQLSDITTLSQAFDIRPGEIISLIGAGGKSSLLYALARELAEQGERVITTTTTKIYPPSPSDSPCLIVSPSMEELESLMSDTWEGCRHITIASGRSSNGDKLLGLDPGTIARLTRLRKDSYIIVEADGAAGRSLKAPDIRFEPVIPEATTLLIPLIGIDILGRPFSEENVFRTRIASKLTKVRQGDPVNCEMIMDLMTHKYGMLHGSPQDARIIPFINKTDLENGLENARILAVKILGSSYKGIDRVVIGQAKKIPPFLEIF